MSALLQLQGQSQPRPFTRHACVNALCAVSALVIHALLISPMLIGNPGYKKPRTSAVQGPGATEIISSAQFTTLVLISEPRPSASSESALADLASRGIAPDDLAVRILSPDPNPAFELAQDEDTDPTPLTPDEQRGDTQERALLFDRYLKQISARIDRAWIRPASPVRESLRTEEQRVSSANEPDDVFTCELRVLQNAQGRVLEIMLMDCDGSVTWQQSLVAAIERASPLPAPPHPSVFTTALILKFEGRSDRDRSMQAALGAGTQTNNAN
jgi:hypothetical protein